MIKHARWMLWLCWCVPSLVVAQAPLIVVTPRSTFAQQVAERLRAGLDMKSQPLDIVVDDAPAHCEATSPIAPNQATITIEIGSDGRIQLCVLTRTGLSTRQLGPLPALDATAVEQIATVTEASLEALRELDASQSITAQPDVVVEPMPTPVQGPPSSLQSTPPVQAQHQPSPISDAPTDEPRATSTLPYAVTASYQSMLWNGDTLVHGLHASAQGMLTGSPLWLGFGFGFALPFEKRQSGVGASFWGLALDLRLGLRAQLSDDIALDLSLGPRLEWLLVDPFVETAAMAQAERASDAFGLSSVLEVSPKIAITDTFSVALGVGVIFAHTAHAYGVTQGDSLELVMDQRMPRPYLLVGAQLAL